MKHFAERISKDKLRRKALSSTETEELLRKDGSISAQHRDTLMLQRTAGNRAAVQMVQRTKPLIQRDPIRERLIDHMQIDNGPVTQLAMHIFNIMGDMDTGNYESANARLFSNDVAGLLGYSIKTNLKQIDSTGKQEEQIKREINVIISKSMHFKGRLELPSITVKEGKGLSFNLTTGEPEGERTPANDEALAWQVLPVFLEEWIHMFQNRTGDLLSRGTREFQVSDDFTQDENSENWNLKEVDIYAIYRDLGWNRVLDEFVARYPERMKYKDFADYQDFVKASPSLAKYL